MNLPDLQGLADWLQSQLPGVLTGVGSVGGWRMLRLITRVEKDLPVCQARIVREGGVVWLPWQKRVVIHQRPKGRTQITPL